MTEDLPRRWLALPGPGSYVILSEQLAVGPDVFVKLDDYRALADRHQALREAVAPLLDPEGAEAFTTCWEFYPTDRCDADAKQMLANLKEAYDR